MPGHARTGAALAATLGLWLAGAAAAGLPEEAGAHREAARRQTVGSAAAERRMQAACGAPGLQIADAAAAEQALRDAESAYRAALERAGESTQDSLRSLVVQRECAAMQAALAQPAVRRPVWLHSELAIVHIRPARGGGGFEVEARARTAWGPVVGSRITFSQGLHRSCFGLSDARGSVRCTLVDTHPHGPASPGEPADEAHEGPLTATLAGSVSPERVELPAVARRGMPAAARPAIRQVADR